MTTEPDRPDPPTPTGRTRPKPPRHRAFAVVTPGLEALTAAELTELGLKSARVTTGGVRFTATTRQLYAANLWLRTATRIVVRIAHFEARTFAALEAEVALVDWDAWLDEDRPVRFRVSSTGSKLHHTGAIAERLHRASGFPATPPAATATADPALETDPLVAPHEQLVVVRVVHDEVTVSIDSSGAPLYQRGWRQDVAKAPLRESLAAALLLAAGWDRAAPLLDPMCGSGTIAIEAAMMARGLAPGRRRAFAFAGWPTFEPGTWASVVEQARRSEQEHQRTRDDVAIVASDRDGGAVHATTANAERAGVADDIDVVQRSVSDIEAFGTGPGLLLSNPPYGRRVRGGADLRDLYARLGSVARDQLTGWSVGLLVDDVTLGRATGLRLGERLATSNGGIPVRLLVGSARA